MNRFRQLKPALSAGIALLSALLAQPRLAVAQVPRSTKMEPKFVPTGKSVLSGDLGIDFVSQYISAGIVAENQGVIAQPYLNLYLRLYKGEGWINVITLNLGFGASLHSKHTGAPPHSRYPAYFEQDLLPGFSVVFAKNFTLKTTYGWLLSPSGAFQTPTVLKLRLDYNDADLLGRFALHPHVLFLRELENKISNGRDQGNYYEAVLSPSLPPLGPIRITFPLTAGFGSHNFYAKNQGFGFFSAGANALVALSFIPRKYGSWVLKMGTTRYYLNKTLAAPTVIRARGHYETVFNGGIGVEF